MPPIRPRQDLPCVYNRMNQIGAVKCIQCKCSGSNSCSNSINRDCKLLCALKIFTIIIIQYQAWLRHPEKSPEINSTFFFTTSLKASSKQVILGSIFYWQGAITEKALLVVLATFIFESQSTQCTSSFNDLSTCDGICYMIREHLDIWNIGSSYRLNRKRKSVMQHRSNRSVDLTADIVRHEAIKGVLLYVCAAFLPLTKGICAVAI